MRFEENAANLLSPPIPNYSGDAGQRRLDGRTIGLSVDDLDTGQPSLVIEVGDRLDYYLP